MSQITMQEAKGFLRVGHTAQDIVIQGIIDGVEEWTEQRIGHAFMVAAADVDYLAGGGLALRPKTRPVISVTEVFDTEADAAESADDYDLVRDGIYRDSMDRWESSPENRWRVTYVGGAAPSSGLKTAMLMLIHRVYENRDGITHQSAAGYGTTFDMLAQGDITTMMQPYIRGGFIG